MGGALLGSLTSEKRGPRAAQMRTNSSSYWEKLTPYGVLSEEGVGRRTSATQTCGWGRP